MAYPLSMLSGMPKSLVETLAQEGVFDSEGLLAAGRLPRQRDALAAASAVDATEVDVWVSVADLVRVSVLTPQSAELIVRSGVARDVRELANAFARSGAGGLAIDSVSVPSEGEDAVARFASSRERLEGFAAARRWAARVPWDADLALAAEEAANLSPRLVGRTEDLSQSARKRLLGLEATAGKLHGRTSRLIAFLGGGILIGGSIVFLAFIYSLVIAREVGAVEASVPAGGRTAVVEVGRQLGWWVAASNIIGVCIVFMGLVAFMHAMSRFANLTFRMWRAFGMRFMLSDVTSQREYLAHSEAVLRTGAHFERVTLMTVVGSLALGTLVMVAAHRGVLPGASFGESVAVTLAIVLIPAAVALHWPSLRYLVRRYRRASPARAPVIRALSVLELGKTLLGLGLAIVFLLLLSPAARTAVHLGHWVAEPLIEQAVSHASSRFERLRGENGWEAVGPAETGTALAHHLTDRLNALDGTITAAVDDFGEVMPVFVRTLLPTLLLVLLLAIVVPFLLLGGWLRGAFFFLLLLVLSFTETGAQSLVRSSLAQVFGIAEDSGVILLFVGFAVFGNAILFEWVYETTLERKPTCVACGGAIDRGSRYCSHCGIEQA